MPGCHDLRPKQCQQDLAPHAIHSSSSGVDADMTASDFSPPTAKAADFRLAQKRGLNR
jgi:hypothetical protein